MSELPAVVDALASHGAFEGEDGEFVTRTTAAEGRVAAGGTEGDAAVEIAVRVPTIDAVVAGETVAPVVREGWLETFERRLEDLGGVARGAVATPSVTVDPDTDEVVVETVVRGVDPGALADDAKAVVDSVEGTFVQGLVPGYDYRAPASELLERARSAGERPGPG